MDKTFLKDEIQTAYLAYEKFEKFKRPETKSITDYIVEFERLYYKIKTHKMVLRDGVLQSANLSAEQQELARATASLLKYDTMVAQLKKIFRDSMSASTISTKDIKVEPVYHRESYRRNYPIQIIHENYKENIQQDKKQNLRYFQKSQKTNPLDHSGKPSRYSICEPIFH